MRRSSNNYFTKETEEWIVKYNHSTDPKEREKIFTQYIYFPFYKLAENIIHTFKFSHLDVNQIEDMKLDIVRMLWEEKISMFDPSKGAKAYSYFGTIVKRHLICTCNRNYDKKKKQVSMEYCDKSDDEMQTEVAPVLTLSSFIDTWVSEMYDQLPEMFPKESDQEIADAVLTVFKTRHSLEVIQKKALYVYVREITGCETPYLTRVIARLKESFYDRYNELMQADLIRDEDIYLK